MKDAKEDLIFEVADELNISSTKAKIMIDQLAYVVSKAAKIPQKVIIAQFIRVKNYDREGFKGIVSIISSENFKKMYDDVKGADEMRKLESVMREVARLISNTISR